MIFGSAILAAALAASPQGGADGTMTVTGQVTAIYGNIHFFNVQGKSVRISGLPSVLRAGDIAIVRNCHRSDMSSSNSLWSTDAAVAIGHADPPPPLDVPLERLLRENLFLTPVRTEGIVEDIVQDDTALDAYLMTLRSGSSRIQATILAEQKRRIRDFDRMLDAKIEFSGVYFDHIPSTRPYHGPVFVPTDPTDIRIVDDNHETLFDLPSVDLDANYAPEDIAVLGRRTLVGTVLACWDGKHVLLQTTRDKISRLHQLTLAFGVTLPPVGACLRVVGQAETDMYRINFTSVRYRILPDGSSPPPKYGKPQENLSDLLKISGTKTVYNPYAFGQLFRLRGLLAPQDRARETLARISLIVDGIRVDVDASVCPDVLRNLQPGSQIDVTGVCILDIDNWRPDTPQPPFKGHAIVLRDAHDLKVVSIPSWWTPVRLLGVIAGLFALLVGTLIWNRILDRLVLRRSRELVREQAARAASELRIGERTRLAVELHDTLSQNLTGVTFHIASARNAIGTADETAKSRLTSAEQILKSCHTELRNVLSDLRSSALEEKDFSSAIRTVLKGVEDQADVAVRFDVPRAKLMDSTAHAVLCIVRELVGNAVRHGKPLHVAITGELSAGLLRVEVREDGRGFDPAHCDGPNEGHFGLDGIRNRIQRLDGTFTLTSAPGDGSRAVITIPLSAPTEQKN